MAKTLDRLEERGATDPPRPKRDQEGGAAEGPLGHRRAMALQRSVGNQATGRILAIQRLAPDPWAKKPEAKKGLLRRGGLAIKSFFTTAFANDPSRIKPDMPDVDETTRVQMHQILGDAITERDRRKKELMEQHFIPEEAAEQQANREAFKDIPESWRPRVVTAAEWQIKRNKAALQEERVRALATSQVSSDYTANVDKAALKRDRGHAFKASLIGKPPEEAERLLKAHNGELEKREAWKKDRKASQEAHDKQLEKEFEARLKTLPKDQQKTAQRVFDAHRQKLTAQRRLQKYRERMNGLPADEIDRRMKMYAAKNGLERGLDLSDYDAATTGLGVGGGVTKAGGGLSSASKEIAKLSGNTNVSGVTEKIDGRTIQTQVGTATDAGDLAGSATSLISTGTTVTQLIRGFDALEHGDPAQQVTANDNIIDGILGIGQNAENLGEQGVSLAKDLGGRAVDGVGLQAMGIPGFDAAANFFAVLRSGRKVGDNAKRAHTSGKLAKAAQKLKDDVLGHVIGHVRNRGIQLATHYSIDALASSLKMAGDIGILTGVGAAAGGSIKIAGSVVGGVNTAARKVADSYLAGKAQGARGEARLALPGSADNLLRHDPLQVAQTIVDRARQGDPLYLKALQTFGLDREGLAGASDATVRELILAKLEQSEDPTTLTNKAGSLLGKIKGGIKSFGAGVRDVFLKPKEISELRKVKNELGYGGRSDRGFFWGAQQFFTGPSSVPAQKAHLRQVLQRSQIEPQNKARLLALTMNYEQKQELAGDEENPHEISGPQIDYEAMTASQLESVLADANLSVDEHARVAVLWLEKRDREMVRS